MSDTVDVEAIGLRKKYGTQLAVDDVSLLAQSGEVTVLLGGNGAGKSTTLRMLLGLVKGEGAVTYDGIPLDRHRHPHRVVGVYLGSPAFHPDRRVASRRRRSDHR